jgi:branched-subunit amino acid aminotransferase/4-amino-4-deoxychorismate lyase
MSDIGVFTTIKISRGIPLFFDKHKARLLLQAEQLGLTPPPFSLTTITSYLTDHALENCALKITITDTLLMEHRPLPQPKPQKVITVQDTRDKVLRTLKTTNRVANNNAHKLAEENAADEALFVRDELLIESTYANIFSIDKDGAIITPPLDGTGLKGITRQVIMERTNVKEIPILKDIAMPLVLVNSLRVQPVVAIDGRMLPDATVLVKKLNTLLEL